MERIENAERMNGMMDLMKVVMALLVVGIHTSIFGFNLWLDRGYGLITRECVPFFFVASAYFYWLKEKGPGAFLKRILLLYLIWCILYLPFDLDRISGMSLWENLAFYFWRGNDHALWYLLSSAIGFLITYLLLKVFRPKLVLVLGLLFLVIGCLKSTWSPLLERLFQIPVEDWLGSRNGLFYAFPYTALGMYIAKSPDQGKGRNVRRCSLFLILSFLALVVESVIFVSLLDTQHSILWVSVFPFTGFLFLLVNNLSISMPKHVSLLLRKISTLIYVSHGLFLILYQSLGGGILFFLAVSASAVVFSLLVIRLSEIKGLRWLKYLY
jgi:serine/alanine racemase